VTFGTPGAATSLSPTKEQEHLVRLEQVKLHGEVEGLGFRLTALRSPLPLDLVRALGAARLRSSVVKSCAAAPLLSRRLSTLRSAASASLERPRLPQRRRQDHPDADPLAQSERDRRALRQNRARRVPRLAADPQPAPPRTGPPRFRPALQRTPPASRAEPRPARPRAANATTRQPGRTKPRHSPRPAGRTHPRIQRRGVKPDFCTPHFRRHSSLAPNLASDPGRRGFELRRSRPLHLAAAAPLRAGFRERRAGTGQRRPNRSTNGPPPQALP
jgi:hypothetical protein